jgi:hypothetical protein
VNDQQLPLCIESAVPHYLERLDQRYHREEGDSKWVSPSGGMPDCCLLNRVMVTGQQLRMLRVHETARLVLAPSANRWQHRGGDEML